MAGPLDVPVLTHNPDLLLQLMMRNRMMPAGLAGVVGKPPKPPTPAQILDPYRLSKVSLAKPWTEIDVARAPNMTMVPKNVMSPAQFYEANKGGVILPATGDKSIGGYRVTRIEGAPVDVQTHGGGNFMRTHSPTGSVWAADQGQSKKLSNSVERLREKYGTDKVFISHATMGPHSADYSHQPSDALLGMLKSAQISRAGAAAVKARMAQGTKETVGKVTKHFTYPDFPGINSPKLREWLDGAPYRRKHFVKLMDSREMQEVGVPSVAAARLSISDVSQLGIPDMWSGMHIARVFPGMVSGGAMPHPSYPVQTPGRYEGSFGAYLPPELMYPNWFAANAGLKQNLRRSFFTSGTDRAQPITQQWLDQIMPAWLLSQGK